MPTQPTPKQLAWRKKFAKLNKAGAFKKKTGAKKANSKKSNSVSCIRNGKRIYGAAAQAVLNKRANGSRGLKRSQRKTATAYKKMTSKTVGAWRGENLKVIRAKMRGESRKKKSNSLTQDASHSIAVRRHFRSGGTSAWKDAEKRGQQRLFSMNGGRKRNSAGTTAQAYAQFQGRESASTVNVFVPDGSPKDVYVLGMLTEIKTDREDITFDPDEAFLVADKHDNLFIGATKATNGAFDKNEFLGEVKEISYVTTKAHLDGQEIEYVHKLGEEGGALPALITNEKKQLEIIGGDYFITEDGIRN